MITAPIPVLISLRYLLPIFGSGFGHPSVCGCLDDVLECVVLENDKSARLYSSLLCVCKEEPHNVTLCSGFR
ncbi:hypothetical protein BJ165DRAFT_1078508 [Panaeolus papilionaceus]|nr:hypothetical protein BJ165DRAFT_1078508 [Panaeolus papilionaceus]